MVHAGKSEVFDRGAGERRLCLIGRGGRIELTAADGLEERLQRGMGRKSEKVLLRHG
jgi:hypothetical protein